MGDAAAVSRHAGPDQPDPWTELHRDRDQLGVPARVAGASFIVPAALITAAVAWAYVRFGTLPLAESLLAGVKPAVIAAIAIAVWRLGKIAIHD